MSIQISNFVIVFFFIRIVVVSMSVQWRVRLPLLGHFQIHQQQMSLQGFIFRKSHFLELSIC